MPSLGEKIRDRRVLLGWGQKKAAFEMGVAEKTLSRWENDKTRPQPHHIPILIDKLGLGETDLSNVDELTVQYRSFGYEEVVPCFGSFHNFLTRLIELDTSALSYVDEEEEGDEHFWAPLFENYGFTWGAVSVGQTVVGYWHFLTLSADAFTRAKVGDFVEVQLSDTDFEEMFIPGHYRMFISMIVLEKEHRNPAAFSMLRIGFEHRIQELAEQGFFFSEVCAYAAIDGPTPWKNDALQGQGARLCRALGMRDIGKSYLDEPIYYMVGEDVSTRGMLSRNAQIRALYAAEF